MAGTRAGGQAAAASNKARHGVNFYAKIALEGQKAWERNGRKSRGFAYMKANGQLEKVKAAGKKGGIARRKKKGIKVWPT